MKVTSIIRNIVIASLLFVTLFAYGVYSISSKMKYRASLESLDEMRVDSTFSLENSGVVHIGTQAGDVLRKQSASAQSIIDGSRERYPYVQLDKREDASLTVSIPYSVYPDPIQEGDKIVYTSVDENIDIVFYRKYPQTIEEQDSRGNTHNFVINKQGGVEFDTVLNKKPSSSEFVFPIETEGLVFRYQPALDLEGYECTETTCWDEEGEVAVFQPEMTVGSYSVYREDVPDIIRTENEDHETGKAFHVYRPKVIDNEGDEIWGELSIDEEEGIMTVFVNPGWLETAVYPVTIDPNFGYEDVYGSTCNMGRRITGNKFIMPETGIASSISMYMTNVYGQGHGMITRTAVYKGSDYALVAQTEAVIANNLTIDAWNVFNFDTPPILTGGEEYILVADAEGGNRMTCEDTGVANSSWYEDYYISRLGPEDFPATISGPTSSWKKSIYCTYSPSASLQITGTSTMIAGDYRYCIC